MCAISSLTSTFAISSPDEFLCVSYGPYTLLQNDSFFTFIFAVFLLNLFCGCILLHKPIYGVAVLQKRTEAILEYYLRFKFGNRRH